MLFLYPPQAPSINLAGTTSGLVTLSVAAAAGTHTIKLPTGDGSANQLLKTDGSGQWGWVTLLPYASPCGLYLSTQSLVSQPTTPRTSQGNLYAVVDVADFALIPNSTATDFVVTSPGEKQLSLTMTSGKIYDVFLYNDASPTLLLSTEWSNNGQAITAASNATPIVITSNAHGMSNGDQVEVTGVLGNLAANGTWIVANKTTNTYELTGSVGSGAYISGGWMAGRVDALGTLKGIIVNNATIGAMGAKRGLWLGVVKASGTNITEQSETKQYIGNVYNKKKIVMTVNESTSSWSYSTGMPRQANGNAANRVDFVLARPSIISAVLVANSSSTSTGTSGIGVDSITVMSGKYTFTVAQASVTYGGTTTTLDKILGSGSHYLSWLEAGPGFATTWYGYSSQSWNCGLSAGYTG